MKDETIRTQFPSQLCSSVVIAQRVQIGRTPASLHPSGLRCVFSSDSAIGSPIYVGEKGENLVTILVVQYLLISRIDQVFVRILIQHENGTAMGN